MKPARRQCRHRSSHTRHTGCCQQRADPAAGRIEQHVGGDHLRLRVGRGGQDQALVGHVQCLYRQIQQQHAQYQPAHVQRQRSQRGPAQQQQQQRSKGNTVGMAAIAPVPAARGGQRAEQADQCERTDGGMAERMRRCAQWQRHAAPEQPERGEQQQSEHAALAQHRLLTQQSDQPDPGRGIGHRQPWQAQPQHRAADHHQHRRQHIHRTPAPQVGHATSHHPGQQQADHHAGLGRPHHAATLMRARCSGGIGNQPLGHRGAEQAHRQHAQQQRGGVAGQGNAQQGHDQRHALRRHQAPAFQPVAQRHQPQQRDHRAQLSSGNDRADPGGADVQVGGQRIQQRLGVVDVGHAEPGGAGEQQQQGRGGTGQWCGNGHLMVSK